MTLIVRLSGAASLALFALASVEAQAATRFGVACIKNDTSTTVGFLSKVGNGQWEHKSLEPGGSRVFWHTYDYAGENKAPPLYVKFDSDLQRGQKFDINYKLERYAAAGHSCREGKLYGLRPWRVV